ncbi:protein IQ-DOMAIN 22-like [Cornus florida]|uniref:protein IQ-DOMAIN 22-like n=1 Tax=Cornus florida TaxID=4283 RepID=UPI00289C1B51|nr:protein IQ-DOMAIN 22-like [Cornus florida]
MGKAARWFRGLFGLKKEESPSQSATDATRSEPTSAKKRWGFVKSHREQDCTWKTTGHRRNSRADVPPRSSDGIPDGGVDPNEQAITAAVRPTSSEGSDDVSASTVAYVSGASCGIREDLAAIKIQAHFRAYLSRRALRALKALVKLQALVRGNIVRKHTAYALRSMQALLRAQARARAGRAQISQSPHSRTKSSQFLYPGPATPEKFEHAIRANGEKQNQSPKGNRSKSVGRSMVDQDKARGGWSCLDCQMNEGLGDRGRSFLRTRPTDDKFLEIDNREQHLIPKRRIQFQYSHRALGSDQISHSLTTSKDSTTHQTLPSQSSCEVESPIPLFTRYVEETSFRTADDNFKRGPCTPTKSDSSRSYLSNCSEHPNYMAYTESSRAKLRSLSAPKQRLQFERSSSTKRHLIHGYGDSRSSMQRDSAFHAIFASKAYPGSGHLDRLGIPVRSS